MNTKEAIERVRTRFDKWALDNEDLTALQALGLVTAESEDERIRKQLIDAIKIGRSNSGISFTEEAASRFITWLEKHSEEEIQKIRKEEYTNGFNDAAGFGKQKEQKPAESISQLTVQGKGVYKICPRCKERMIRDDSMVYTSMPPQYIYECPKCGERECDTVMYDSSVDEKQQEQKPILSDRDLTDFEIEVHEIIAQARNDSRLNDADVLKQFEEEAAFALMLKANKLIEQKSAEWSEEDRDILLQTAAILKANFDSDEKFEDCDYDCETLAGKLLEMRYRISPSWKPSEEQMKWLKDVIETVTMTCRQQIPLESLYADLQKLIDAEKLKSDLEKQKEQKPIKMEVYEVGNGTTICGQDYKCKKDYKEGNCWYIKDAIYHCGRDGYLTDQNGVSWSCTPEWFNEYIQSNTEWAEEEKTRFVSGQFLQCKLSFEGFKEGEHYWLEYVGNDTYVGRSDNILNQKFHITPRQLYTLFSQQLEEVQGPPEEEKQVSLNYEPPFDENPSDKEIVEALIKHLKEQDGFLTAINCVSTKAILSWLEKQKEQKPNWKPSEEQMKALERASTNKYLSAEQYDILVSLYENLKKLM